MTAQSIDVAKLYVDESAALLRRLVRKLGNYDEAEDVLQDAYLRILSLPVDHVKLRCPKAFLFTIASNLVVEYVRRDKRKERVLALMPNTEIVFDDDEYNLVGSDSPVDDQVDSIRRLSQVVEALRSLPEKYRDAFMIHKFAEFSYAEVAVQMGVSVSLIEKLISGSLRHLRDRMGCDS